MRPPWGAGRRAGLALGLPPAKPSCRQWYKTFLFVNRVTRRLKKNCPIFGNVAKTIAKLLKLKLKVENSCIKMLLNVEISTTNFVLKLLI